MIDILSFGGGVGSWGYAALVIQEKIRMPWLAFIVDTGRECPSTWEYIDRHRDQLPFEFFVVKQPLPSLLSGNGNTFLPGGYDLEGGSFLHGFCSAYWKREVARRWLVKKKKITKYNLAFGMHADEWKRMTTGRPAGSVKNYYPIVDLGLTRKDCAKVANDVFGEIPPRSRCWMCPGQNTEDWNQVAENWPDLYIEALKIDTMAREIQNLTLFGKDYEHPCGGECFV